MTIEELLNEWKNWEGKDLTFDNGEPYKQRTATLFLDYLANKA